MGLKFNLFKHFKNKAKKKLFVIGFDCGIADWEVTEVVLANDFNQAIQYAENSAIQLYEDMELAPSYFEFDGTENEYEQFAEECLFNAIGFWCRDFNEKEDKHLISSLGVIEIVGS